MSPTKDKGPAARRSSAHLVAAGILLSRIAGLVRERVFARYFGTSLSADAWRAALRMPNVLQNLLGEGTLSASFIPVYARLLEEGREEEAGRVAGAVFAILVALAGALTLLGVVLAPVLVSLFTPGFEGERRELTIALTRIIFPMAGILVLSAWSLGILNSHRRFFIPYVAPVLWNAAMITVLLVWGPGLAQPDLVLALGWGALVGGALQFGIQLPWVLRLERSLKLGWGRQLAGVRTTLRNAGPAVLGRGVVQISSWVDLFLASFLVSGAVAVIGYAQQLYVLPVSLFGMSVAAAELPELSRQREGAHAVLNERVTRALRDMSFLVVPSVVGYIVIGDILTAALYQTGDFDPADTAWTHVVLAAYSVGLLASTGTRLFSSAYFALHDTRTPAKIAALRVLLAAVLGAGLMLLGRNFQLDPARPLSPAGLALGAGIAAWLEWALLRRGLRDRIGDVGIGAGVLGRMAAAALLAGLAGRGVDLLLPELHPILTAVLVLAAFGPVYFGVTHALGLEESRRGLQRIGRMLGRRG